MEQNKALNILAGICSSKECCCHDIQAKLKKWDIPETEAARIIEFLYKNNFLNDRRFALSYANDKFKFNKWGKQKISQMLRQKEISASIITEALFSLEEEDYEEMCLSLLEQKIKTIKETDLLKKRNKLFRFAAGRGFGFDIIRKCLSHLQLDTNDEFYDSDSERE